MITVVDYGMGNLGSILNMFKKLRIDAVIASDVLQISSATKLLLPGVGAFDAAIKKINEQKLRSVLEKKVFHENVPILGICLGMQLLTESSEEGTEKGLGWIPGKAIRFSFAGPTALKIPHMGWNYVEQINPSPLTKNLPESPRFYFVHSYYVQIHDPNHSVMKTHYGIDFDSVIQKDNIFGAQFHPEKSHKYGMKLLENFAAI